MIFRNCRRVMSVSSRSKTIPISLLLKGCALQTPLVALGIFLAVGSALAGQTFATASTLTATASTPFPVQRFQPLQAFALEDNPLVIHRVARADQPFSVTGPRGAILGQQDGTFELWLLPVKILRDVHLTAKLDGYDAVIHLNDYASDVEVRPDHTTITYAHAAITVKQHMFIPHEARDGIASAVVLFEVHAARPAILTLYFTPSMEREWPAPNFGRPSGSWLPVGTGGAYSLETDNPAFFGMVAMPQSQHGPMRPYQERPETEPFSFNFSYDPAHDDHRFYPLVAGFSDGKGQGEPAREALLTQLLDQEANLPGTYASTADYYKHFFDTRLSVETPDPKFNQALKWAETAIEESRITRDNGVGLAGGWFTSGDSARPGFGWFFGRDTLWTLYAVNSYGDFALSREAMNFLLAHQRADGKMMHEYSQTAETVDWVHLPYLYAAADATPLFVMQMEDYVRTSGDTAYLKQHWDEVQRAYAFIRAHTTDGVYDNSQGTGWVEEWIPRLPHQEIYLAALDQQSSAAMSQMALWMGNADLSDAAAKTAAMIRSKLDNYRGSDGMYAFSRNLNGTYERVPSIFPSVAWWSGSLGLPDAGAMLQAWSGSPFSTDWGMRSVPTGAAIYDPISYHHGSVWPLYTGWVSMAEYRTDRSLSAFAHLSQNVNLTWLQDPGAVTEVLSGFAYEPLGRSSSHQLWSSAMVISPAVRGMLGLEADAMQHTLRVAPQLPSTWDSATVRNVAVGPERYTVTMQRSGSMLKLDAVSPEPTVLCLTHDLEPAKPCDTRAATHHTLSQALPAFEVAMPPESAREGQQTSGLKVLDEKTDTASLTIVLEGPAGSTWRLPLRQNSPQRLHVQATGADLEASDVVVTMPAGSANEATARTTVRLNW